MNQIIHMVDSNHCQCDILYNTLSNIIGIEYITPFDTTINMDACINQDIINTALRRDSFKYKINKSHFQLSDDDWKTFVIINYYYYLHIKKYVKSNRINFSRQINLIRNSLNNVIELVTQSHEYIYIEKIKRLYNFICNYSQLYTVQKRQMYFYINIIINQLLLYYKFTGNYYMFGQNRWDPVWMLNKYLWSNNINAIGYVADAPIVCLQIMNQLTRCSLHVSSYGNNDAHNIIKGGMNMDEMTLLKTNTLVAYQTTAIRETNEEIGVNLLDFVEQTNIIYAHNKKIFKNKRRVINLILNIPNNKYEEIITHININTSYEISKIWLRVPSYKQL